MPGAGGVVPPDPNKGGRAVKGRGKRGWRPARAFRERRAKEKATGPTKEPTRRRPKGGRREGVKDQPSGGDAVSVGSKGNGRRPVGEKRMRGRAGDGTTPRGRGEAAGARGWKRRGDGNEFGGSRKPGQAGKGGHASRGGEKRRREKEGRKRREDSKGRERGFGADLAQRKKGGLF